MTKLLITTLIFLLFSCRNNKSEQKFQSFDRTDINHIIEAIIFHDSLKMFKTDSLMPIPLALHLRKLQVTVPDTTTNVPPPVDHNSVSIFNLFNSLVNHHRFFELTDSSYLISQNNFIDSFVLDEKIAQKVFSTTEYELRWNGDTLRNISFYDLTIPILSADQSKAYVEMTTNCSGCGGATAFYLKKVNSKWTVVRWQRLWME